MFANNDPEKGLGAGPQRPSDRAENNAQEDLQGVYTLATGMFSYQEALRLVEARCRYFRGEMTEWSAEHKRLLFARWLYRQGKIRG